MKSQEIEVISKRLHAVFGQALGLSLDKIRRCVSAISDLRDREIDSKLKELFLKNPGQ